MRTLLTSRIDKHLVKFKNTQPDFYNAYMAARRIVDQRGGVASPEAPKVLTVPVAPTSSAKAA